MSAAEKQPLLQPSSDVVEVDAPEANEAGQAEEDKKYLHIPQPEHPLVAHVMAPVRYFTSGAFTKKMESPTYQNGWRYLLIGGNWSKYRSVRFHWRLGAFWGTAGFVSVIGCYLWVLKKEAEVRKMEEASYNYDE